MNTQENGKSGRVRTVILTVIMLTMLSAPLSATWSILIVDTATGEVAMGIATCLNFFDLLYQPDNIDAG